MKVRFTPRAQRRAAAVAKWWRENRPAAPLLFDDELAHALAILTTTPRLGIVYRTKDNDVIHRVMLPKTEQHLYYVVDEAAGVIQVLTIWGARRRAGPKL